MYWGKQKANIQTHKQMGVREWTARLSLVDHAEAHFSGRRGSAAASEAVFLKTLKVLQVAALALRQPGVLKIVWGPGILSCLPLLSPWPGKQKYNKVRARAVLSMALPAAGEECANKESPSPLHVCCCWVAASAPCSMLPLLCCAHHFSIMVNSQNLTVQAFHNRACHHI